jgi:hypothetical protein
VRTMGGTGEGLGSRGLGVGIIQGSGVGGQGSGTEGNTPQEQHCKAADGIGG